MSGASEQSLKKSLWNSGEKTQNETKKKSNARYYIEVDLFSNFKRMVSVPITCNLVVTTFMKKYIG